MVLMSGYVTRKDATKLFSLERLPGFLHHGQTEELVTVLDMDGTIHRGLAILNPRGYSNLELVWELMLHEWRKPLKNLIIALKMLSIQGYDFYLLFLKYLGKITMSERDRALIVLYIRWILRCYDEQTIAGVVPRLPNYAYKDFFPTLDKLAAHTATIMFISKGFSQVVSAYAALIRSRTKVHTIIAANDLDWQTNAPVWQEDSAIVTAGDKAKALESFLAANKQITRALICGDTEEDVSMILKARETLGSANVMAIAIRPKDSIIRAACDVVVASWREIFRVYTKIHQ